MDAGRLEGMRRMLAGEPPVEPDASDPMAAIPIGLGIASRHDPDAFRGMAKIAHILEDPMAVLGDARVFQAAIDAYERRDELDGGPLGPSRDELLAAMATTGSPAAAG
jgi:hypothetical protein